MQKENFNPLLYNYKDSVFLDKLEITLFGPDLLNLYNYCNGFDKKTIINIFENLLPKIEYLSQKKVIHRDIKPENITWGIINSGSILNFNELYLIDYGESISLEEIENDINQDKRNFRCGTPRYMSINCHKNLLPTSLDDIESLLYSLMYLAKIDLPWINMDFPNILKNKEILRLKENMDIVGLCGKEYEFLAKIYIYLKKVREGKNTLNFEVLRELLKMEK